ncbi:hypothetical protein M0Q28_02090 [Patescibacteria group bacterium]|jgi:uncharacterized membrane protein YkgB|nr:hypothetical protein [Patescibacteria group bacterium]
MANTLISLDRSIISFVRKISTPLSRFSLFAVFFWFGLLKVVGLSPATGLVQALFDRTLGSVMLFGPFYVFFALFEMLIGVLWLIPKAVRLVTPLLLIHMVMTFLPLLFLPDMAWNGPLVPTFEGQYIIKNLVIVSLALVFVARLHPLKASAA